MDNLGLIQYLKKKQKQIRPKKHKLEAENVTCLFYSEILKKLKMQATDLEKAFTKDLCPN